MLALLPAMARLSLVLADTARGPLLRAERQNCVLSIVERGGGGRHGPLCCGPLHLSRAEFEPGNTAG